MKIRGMTINKYMEKVKGFHGHLAPGMVCGGFMVELAYQNLPENGLYDVIAETRACLPDAIQLLTPCTIGNGWLRIIDTGRFAIIFYDKNTGEGVRIALDPNQLKDWPEAHTWAMKLKPKKEQNKKLLYDEIITAGPSLYKVERMQVNRDNFPKKGKIFTCISCGESYRGADAGQCDACLGKVPFSKAIEKNSGLKAIPVKDASGKTALHDMTRIESGLSKGPAILEGDTIKNSDIELLKSMGKESIYVRENIFSNENLIHENHAALAFAKKIAGKGIIFDPDPREGKIDFKAEIDGVLCIEAQSLIRFNRSRDVMCATRKGFIPVTKEMIVAGTRAIPLYLPKTSFESAMKILDDGPLLCVKPYRFKQIGILVTGTEVVTGRVKDAFIPIMEAYVKKYGLSITDRKICPDDQEKIASAAKDLISSGAEIIIATGGLSVDPDDVTRAALLNAGMVDDIYGAPVLPGAMTLIGRIKKTRLIGVPAGALYFDQTAFDLLFPRLLADMPITRTDMASLAEGGFLDSTIRNKIV